MTEGQIREWAGHECEDSEHPIRRELARALLKAKAAIDTSTTEATEIRQLYAKLAVKCGDAEAARDALAAALVQIANAPRSGIDAYFLNLAINTLDARVPGWREK